MALSMTPNQYDLTLTKSCLLPHISFLASESQWLLQSAYMLSTLHFFYLKEIQCFTEASTRNEISAFDILVVGWVKIILISPYLHFETFSAWADCCRPWGRYFNPFNEWINLASSSCIILDISETSIESLVGRENWERYPFLWWQLCDVMWCDVHTW